MDNRGSLQINITTNRFVMQIVSRIWLNSSRIWSDVDQYEQPDNDSVPVYYCLSPISIEVTKILYGDENTCRKHLRINLSSFRSFVQVLEVKRHGWSREMEAIIFLFWLAAGCSYRVVSTAINIPRSTAFEIISKVLCWTLRMIPAFIKYPNDQELNEISNGFARKGQSNIFHRAAGAMNGPTYVSVLCPPNLHDEYINRKLRYAIQLQVLCDHNGKMLNIFTGYPGSVHDQRVLRNSPLFLNAIYPPAQYFILGDAGYKATTAPIFVVTPYKGTTLSRQQKIFNRHHSLARSVVERCIGDLKNRWRYLFGDRPVELKLRKAVRVIAVCCALQNICITGGDVFNNIPGEPSVHLESDNGPDERSACLFRDQLCEELINDMNRT